MKLIIVDAALDLPDIHTSSLEIRRSCKVIAQKLLGAIMYNLMRLYDAAFYFFYQMWNTKSYDYYTRQQRHTAMMMMMKAAEWEDAAAASRAIIVHRRGNQK